MDFVALKKDPLWKELWSDEAVNAKTDALKNALLNTSEADAHTLGKLRGQLEAFNWLRTLVDSMAERQMREATGIAESNAQHATEIQDLRKWKVR